MGSGMPEIGSRISLISKADIRYEGKLYSVDPEECTIALSSVRSYGTEERKTNYPVPAQNQVYDYILFRGSDIKDIRVLTTTIPNDPAIVQLSVPPSINELQFQSQSGFGPSITSMTMPNVVPGPSRGQPASGEGFLQNAAGLVLPGAGTVLTSIPKSQPVPNISEDESRSSTPSTQNAVQHKNTADSNRPQNAFKSDEQTQQRRPAYQQRDNRPNQQNRYQQQQKPQYQQQRYPQHQQQQNQRYPQQQRYMQPQYRDYRDSNNQYRDSNNQYRDSNNQYRNQNDYRDQYVQRQYPKWNNQRTGQQSNQQQNYQSAAYQNRKPRNTLKFENDFDFEQANSQFEEVKSKLASVKIDDSIVKVNGDVEAKKEDSGNEVSGEENDPDNEDKPIFYDKVKSFFDQISYEAIERSKGHTQRLDWKTERKINSETFGPVALRRNNNFRGPRPGGNYYNNYQSNNYQGNNYHQNRNPAMANKFRGGFRQKTPQTRRPYNEVKVNDDSKGNQSA